MGPKQPWNGSPRQGGRVDRLSPTNAERQSEGPRAMEAGKKKPPLADQPPAPLVGGERESGVLGKAPGAAVVGDLLTPGGVADQHHPRRPTLLGGGRGGEGGVGVIVGCVWVDLVIIKSGGLVVPPLADIVEAPNVAGGSACVRRGTVDAQKNTWEGGKDLTSGNRFAIDGIFLPVSIGVADKPFKSSLPLFPVHISKNYHGSQKKLLTTALRVGAVGGGGGHHGVLFNPPILTHPPPHPCHRPSLDVQGTHSAPPCHGRRRVFRVSREGVWNQRSAAGVPEDSSVGGKGW